MSVTDEQIILFWERLKGRANAYGTYDPRTSRAWQVKEPVTAKVIRAHLQGQRPFGVYLLDGERIHAIAADFDQDDPEPPGEFRRVAQDCGLPVYLERSKRKGYHAWTFLAGASGVPAAKARRPSRMRAVVYCRRTVPSPPSQGWNRRELSSARASEGRSSRL